MEAENVNQSRRKNHRWDADTDTCINCGLVRKRAALTRNLLALHGGTYLCEYLVAGTWINRAPSCDRQNQPK